MMNVFIRLVDRQRSIIEKKKLFCAIRSVYCLLGSLSHIISSISLQANVVITMECFNEVNIPTLRNLGSFDTSFLSRKVEYHKTFNFRESKFSQMNFGKDR